VDRVIVESLQCRPIGIKGIIVGIGNLPDSRHAVGVWKSTGDVLRHAPKIRYLSLIGILRSIKVIPQDALNVLDRLSIEH
jgi:hypothetical protein